MDSENSTINNLNSIFDNISFDLFEEKEISSRQIKLLEESLKDMLKHIIQVFESSSVSKYEVSKVVEVELNRLRGIPVNDKDVRQHTANYLKEIISLLDLDEEFRLAIYLWPIQGA